MADGGPVGAHLGLEAGGKADLVEALEDVLAVDVAGGVVLKDEHEAGDAGEGAGAEMGEAGDAAHLDFNGDGDLALDFFGGAAGPLGDDLDVVVGDVWVCLNGEATEGDDTPDGEGEDAAEDEPAAFEREVDEGTDHWVTALSSERALVTTWVPGEMPSRIS